MHAMAYVLLFVGSQLRVALCGRFMPTTSFAFQAFVWDLGFKDMPVDKIVDASVDTRGRGPKCTAQNEELMRATMDALSSRTSGRLGPRYRRCIFHI